MNKTIAFIVINSDVVLVSDPYTMFIVEGLTGIPTIMIERAFIYEEGYTPEALNIMRKVKYILAGGNITELKEYVKIIYPNAKRCVVIYTSRTHIWLNKENVFFVWYIPKSKFKISGNISLLTRLFEDNSAKLIYSIPNYAYVFKIKLKD